MQRRKLSAGTRHHEDRSQLGHYAQKLAAGGFADDELQASLPRVRAVLYLTQDPVSPEAELERADGESLAEVAIFWSSWRNLSRCATKALARTPAPQPEHQSQLNDLIDDLAARGLAMRRPFAGFEFDRA